jgi:hypothetical protein
MSRQDACVELCGIALIPKKENFFFTARCSLSARHFQFLPLLAENGKKKAATVTDPCALIS